MDEVAQDLNAGRLTQLFERLGLNLTNSFTGDPVLLANFFQGLGFSVSQTKPHGDDAGVCPFPVHGA